MKHLIAALIAFAPLATTARAGAGIQVIAAAGDVTFNGKPVKVGEIVQPPGQLKTGDASDAKVYVRDAKTLSILKPGTIVEFSASEKTPGVFRLVEGVSRWVVGKIRPDQPVVVATKTAVMGVRGTEFMAIYNGVLGETEIVSFAGQIEFRRKDKPQSKNLVNAGQWGGVGGRFGEDVGKILTLPQPALDRFLQQTDLQTTLKDAVTSPEFHGHKVPK